jgi:hypothetical protein
MTYYEYIRAIRASDLNYMEKLVAIILASYYDFKKQEPCWPTNKTLAEATGLSVSSVVRAKMALSRGGYLLVIRQWNSSCRYVPMIPQTAGPSPIEQLNTHINTHINTNRNIHINNDESSNEDSYVDSNISFSKEEDITIEEYNQSDNPSLTSFKAQAAAADNYWLKKADEIWSDYETN